MKKISLALIGAGGISARWVEAILKNHNISLRVVMDKDLTKATIRARQFDNCLSENRLDRVLGRSDIDAVIVATPHKFLAEISRKALLAGKHVLSEKPGAISDQEMSRVVAAAKRSGRSYMIGFNHRFHAAFLEAKRIVDSGKIGRLLFIRARYGFGGRPGYAKEWRFNKKISGGGELIDQGIHMIDLARWFLGDFKRVNGFTPNLFWGRGVEDNGFALLQTAKGQVASIHVSWTNWQWIHSFEIIGSDGYLYINGLDQRYGGPERLIIGKRDFNFQKPPREKTIVFKKETSGDSFKRELAEFVKVVSGKPNVAPDGQDAREALKIVRKIYEQN